MKPAISVREAHAHYVATRSAFLAAAKQLREATERESRQVVRTNGRRPRRTAAEADALAKKIRTMMAENPRMTKTAISEVLGVHRRALAHYLYSPKYAGVLT